MPLCTPEECQEREAQRAHLDAPSESWPQSTQIPRVLLSRYRARLAAFLRGRRFESLAAHEAHVEALPITAPPQRPHRPEDLLFS